MGTDLSNYTIDERISAVVCEGMANIPYQDLQRLRAFNDSTPDEMVFKKLNHIGVATVCSLITLGAFPVDIALSLDVPFVPFDKWLDQHAEDVNRAMKGSAQTHLSKSLKLVSAVGNTDVDHAKVAKLKTSEHRWLAQHQDRKNYGDRNVKDDNAGGNTIHIILHDVGDATKSRVVSNQ